MNERKLVIVGEEAWFAEDWEARLDRLEKRRVGRPRLDTGSPAVERRRQRWREQAKRRYEAHKASQASQPVRIGAFHSLGCNGEPHRRKPSCIPIPVYNRRVT